MLGRERVCAVINLDHIHNNVQQINKKVTKGTKILAVIKTDGYGHGAVMLAKELEALDCIFGYAVATIEEAMEIRDAMLNKPILILGYCFPSAFELMIKHDIRATIFDMESARELDRVAGKLGKKAKIHIKVDTGMSRIGMSADSNGLKCLKEIYQLSNLEVEGIFTHFATADEADLGYAYQQLECFKEFISNVEKENIKIPLKHCSNSAGILDLQNANMDIVRAGIILYGLWPSEEVNKNAIDLQPAMELKSTVIFVKKVAKGTKISYGCTYVAPGEQIIATVSIGYGDGYPRCLSNRGYVLIHGKKAPIVGRVCMDQLMIDCTDIANVQRGDSVTLIGTDGAETITMEAFSELSDRINYESVCDIGKRVPRIYIKDGKLMES